MSLLSFWPWKLRLKHGSRHVMVWCVMCFYAQRRLEDYFVSWTLWCFAIIIFTDLERWHLFSFSDFNSLGSWTSQANLIKRKQWHLQSKSNIPHGGTNVDFVGIFWTLIFVNASEGNYNLLFTWLVHKYPQLSSL